MEVARPGSVRGRQQAFDRNASRGLQTVRATSLALYRADIGRAGDMLGFFRLRSGPTGYAKTQPNEVPEQDCASCFSQRRASL